MKLPIPFIGKKETKGEYYLALLLTDGQATAVVLQAREERVKILGSHTESFVRPLEELSMEQLLEVLDRTISLTEEILPPHIETHNTVFGLKASWIDDETKKIKKDYLAKLKKVCDSLDLEPIGFMVITEAISHLMHEEEGAPISAVLVDIGGKMVTVTILRAGKLIETLSSPLGEYTPVTVVEKLLRHVTLPVLPERMLLMSTKEDDRIVQDFVSHHWTKHLPFLHVPDITALSDQFAAHAVASGAAKQMGYTLIDKPELPEDTSTLPQREAKKDEEEESLSEKESPEPHRAEDRDELEEKPLEAKEFGFVQDRDVADIPEEEVKPKELHKALIDQHKTESEAEPDIFAVEHDNIVPVSLHQKPGKKHRSLAVSSLSGKAFFVGLKEKLTSGTGSLSKNPRAVKIGIIAGIILLLVGGLIYGYLYHTKATIMLTVTPEIAEETQEISFSTTGPNDFSGNIIQAEEIEVSVDGSLTRAATGKKDIGEKAKGGVTLYNNGDDDVRLPSGTEMKTSNGLVFLTDKEVKIGSASGDIFSGTKPGTVDVGVVAKEFGSDYNMPSGTKFSVSGNIAAKNDSAFSGGSKKSITVVSKDDIAKLRADLPKSLQAKAQQQLEQQVSSDQALLSAVIPAGLAKESFDNKIDEEAKQVKITGIVNFAGAVYSNDDLLDYAKTVVKETASEQEVNLADNSVKATISDVSAKDIEDITATVSIEAGLLPEIEEADLIRSIKNQSVSGAKETLQSLPQIAKSDISFSPAIPFISNFFPRLPNMIDVQMKSE
ncbi:MAG: hypothetical protein AAB553_02190 [Patescibacteria group bacterium]